jgi:hypothetical protein
MRLRGIVFAVLLGAVALCTPSLAERAPESKKSASHVFVGKVEGVYLRETDGTRYYLVEIIVEKALKGAGLKQGETVYVGCYLWGQSSKTKGKKLSKKEEKRLVMRGAAYDGVPKEGQLIRVFAKQHAGKLTGVYPSWYDLLEEN